MLTSWYAVFGGIVTAGAGAVMTFILADRFVVHIKFNKVNVFVIGGLAFLVTDVVYFTFTRDKIPIEYIFKATNTLNPKTLFVEVFIFWHTLVGTKLYLTVCKI